MVVMYDTGTKVSFEVNLQVKTQDLGDYWVASTRGLGVTVFADTEPAALARMDAAIKFLTTTAVAGSKTGVEQFKDYLNSRGVQYSYTERPNPRWMPAQSPRPVRIESGAVISAT